MTSHSFGRGMTAIAAALLITIGWSGAWAARPVAPNVTGQVTSQPESTVIEVDGKRYLVAVNSQAAAQLAAVHVGDSIGLLLDGPASSSASHVVAIVEHPSSGGRSQ